MARIGPSHARLVVPLQSLAPSSMVEQMFEHYAMLSRWPAEWGKGAAQPSLSASVRLRRASAGLPDGTAGSSIRRVILAATPGCSPSGGVRATRGKAGSSTPSTRRTGDAGWWSAGCRPRVWRPQSEPAERMCGGVRPSNRRSLWPESTISSETVGIFGRVAHAEIVILVACAHVRFDRELAFRARTADRLVAPRVNPARGRRVGG